MGINFVIVALLLIAGCSKEKTTSPSVQSSESALTSVLSGLSPAEKLELAQKLGLTLEQLEQKIAKYSFTLKELAVLAAIVEEENSLSVQLDFQSNQASYVPELPNETSLPCLHYDPVNGFPGQDYIADKAKPYFTELPAVNIVPDELNRPKDYIFAAKYADTGCGTRLLKLACRLLNKTLVSEKAAWQTEKFQSIDLEKTR